jgi:hypothetical protein
MKAILIPASITQAALRATSAHMPAGPKPHKAIEIGRAFYDKKHSDNPLPIDDFPDVERLIRKAHCDFDHAEPPWDRINIIVRSYSKGAKLTPHVDRPDLFGEDVYTQRCPRDSNAHPHGTQPPA